MALEFQAKFEASLAIELGGILPENFLAESITELCQTLVRVGNQKIPLGELFEIKKPLNSSHPTGHWTFSGDLSRVHFLGQGMTWGSILVRGSVGHHCGAQLNAKDPTLCSLTVTGSAGHYCGAEMQAGLITICGSVGDYAGATYAGSSRGMAGGILLVYGEAGASLGRLMRRGWIVVGGACGPYPAVKMLAGSIFIFGVCGSNPAVGMTRGTLALFGQSTTEKTPHASVSPTFRYACTYQPTVMRWMLRELQQKGFPLPVDTPEILETSYALYHGDFLAGGRGELLIAR